MLADSMAWEMGVAITTFFDTKVVPSSSTIVNWPHRGEQLWLYSFAPWP